VDVWCRRESQRWKLGEQDRAQGVRVVVKGMFPIQANVVGTH
jgi:hypothetical protein